MEAKRLDVPTTVPAGWRGPLSTDGPEDGDFGARLLDALGRSGTQLEHLRWSAREEVRLAGRAGLLALLRRRHQHVPTDLEVALRDQAPEALAFRLAGDPRLRRAFELLALR